MESDNNFLKFFEFGDCCLIVEINNAHTYGLIISFYSVGLFSFDP
jgi:hypothetical protein